MKQQQGFTLIELVVVIVILGILAATALPKFVDISSDAEKAAVKGVAAGLGSAASINYAGCSAVNNVETANKCVKVTKCSEVGALMAPAMTLAASPIATDYYLASDTTTSTTNGNSIECTLQKCMKETDCSVAEAKNYTSKFTAVAAGN